MKRLTAIFFLLCNLYLLPSCVREISPEPDAAPEPPTAEQLRIPADLLMQTTLQVRAEEQHSHWMHAGLNAWVWHKCLNQQASLPLAAFAKAREQSAKRLDANTYVWTYLYPAPNESGEKWYKIHLEAIHMRKSKEVKWKMWGATTTSPTERVWLRGKSHSDASEIQLVVHQLAEPFSPCLVVESQQRSAVSMVRYTQINPETEGVGSYIEYRQDRSKTFDQALNVQGWPEHVGALIEIQWKAATMEGRVRDASHFLDEKWHTWSAE